MVVGLAEIILAHENLPANTRWVKRKIKRKFKNRIKKKSEQIQGHSNSAILRAQGSSH